MSHEPINIEELREHAIPDDYSDYIGVDYNQDAIIPIDTLAALLDLAQAAHHVSEEDWYRIRSEGSAYDLTQALDRFTFQQPT